MEQTASEPTFFLNFLLTMTLARTIKKKYKKMAKIERLKLVA